MPGPGRLPACADADHPEGPTSARQRQRGRGAVGDDLASSARTSGGEPGADADLARVRVVGDEVPVDVDAEARAGRQLDRAVDRHAAGSSPAPSGAGCTSVVLDDRRVRRRGDHVEVRRDGQRVRERVRDGVEVVRAGKVEDPLGLADAAAARGVGLHDVDRARLEERQEVPARVHVLAGRDADVELLGQERVPVDVVDRQRLLEEEDVELLELAADLQREVARVALVGVDQDVDVGADVARGSRAARRCRCRRRGRP